MKKIVLFFSVTCVLALSGCFEVTDEITLNADGSGTVTSTNDMSMLVSLMKGMGGAEAMGAEKPTDTTVSLMNIADSISALTAEEKELVKKGKLGLNINLNDEKLVTRLDIPFSKTGQIEQIKALSSKISSYFISKKGGSGMPPGLDEKIPSSDPLVAYFTTDYSAGVIEKKLNKEKYAELEKDEMMKGIKEMSDNGMPITTSVIINLPSPAKSVTGTKVILSEDKKKVTVKTSTEDFFDNAQNLEFKIEY